MSVYNVNHIENLYDDFIACKKNFSNEYSDIKSSYIYTSYDASMKSLEKKLDALYSKIEKGYKNIDTYWSSFINDVKKTEGYLKGKNGTGSIKESAIVSAINKLPKLDTYDAKFTDWFNTLTAKWEKADESFTAKVDSGRKTVAKLEQGWEDWLVLLEEDPKRALKEGGATVVVTATTIISGIYDLAETLVDGYVYIRAECSSAILDVLGFEEKAMEVKTEAANFIQTSYVDKVNDAFYQTIGKDINEASYLKYDSETALKIRSASKSVTEFALATALNCIPGVGQVASAALLLGVGFTSGVGEKAQEVYQTHGTDYDGDTEILLSGVVNAVDFYGKGQIGKLGVTAVKSVVSKSATSVVSNVTTQAAKNPSFMKQLLKNVFDVDNVIDSAAAAANNITYSKEEGWQIDGEKFLQEFGINILITTGTSAVPVIMDAKHASTAKNIDVNVSSVDDAVDSYKSASKSLTNDEILNLNRTLSSSEKTQIWREYNDTLNKWGDDFDSYKNKVINHGAGDLNKLDEMARDLKRLEQIEGKLEIPSSKSVVNATENWTSYNKAQADELAEEISQRPIPAMEKYKVDTNSEEYKRAIREIYSNPSPTGTQFLNNANNPFKNFANLDATVALVDTSVISRMKKSIEILDDFGGNGYGIKALDHYSKTGSVMQMQDGKLKPYITNNGGVRDYISSLDPRIVREYLDNRNNIKKSIEILDDFGGNGYGIKALEHYSKTGSVMQMQDGKLKPYITNNGGVRDYISSLDPRTVREYLDMDIKLDMPNSSHVALNKLDPLTTETYDKFKGTNFISNNFSEQQINDALNSNFHTYATEEDFLAAYGHSWDGVLKGFNRGNEVHINPKYDTPHVRIHEALHNITSVYDSNGKKMVTGFDNFEKIRAGDYSNGDVIFNEGATDYLTHKIVGDGCQSGDYYLSYTFWEGLDDILEMKYGSNDIIFEAYKNHDVTPIKNFMDHYGGAGSFDQIKVMCFADRTKINGVLDKVRVGVNKELNPSATQKMANKFKSIFGG